MVATTVALFPVFCDFLAFCGLIGIGSVDQRPQSAAILRAPPPGPYLIGSLPHSPTSDPISASSDVCRPSIVCVRSSLMSDDVIFPIDVVAMFSVVDPLNLVLSTTSLLYIRLRVQCWLILTHATRATQFHYRAPASSLQIPRCWTYSPSDVRPTTEVVYGCSQSDPSPRQQSDLCRRMRRQWKANRHGHGNEAPPMKLE